MSTSETVTIPAARVPETWEATLYMLGKAGGYLEAQSELSHPDVAGALSRFDAMRGLLDAIGRDDDRTPEEIDGIHVPNCRPRCGST